MTIIFKTDRLVGRPFAVSDIAAFHQWRNDPEVYTFQGWAVPFTKEQATKFISAMTVATPGKPGEWYQVAIEHPDNGPIGDCAFCLDHDAQQATIGFSIASAHQNQGFGSEAIGGLITYLFETYNVHRITADCDVLNLSCIALLERLGFSRESHTIESYALPSGDWASEYGYAMLQREWNR